MERVNLNIFEGELNGTRKRVFKRIIFEKR
jgi:hypothetical protein